MTDALIVAVFLTLAATAAMYGPLEWRLLLLMAAIYPAVQFVLHLIRGRL